MKLEPLSASDGTGCYKNEDTPTNGPPHLTGPGTGQLSVFTHLMDDANAVLGTERNRYPW
jgi:hypothetical protein